MAQLCRSLPEALRSACSTALYTSMLGRCKIAWSKCLIACVICLMIKMLSKNNRSLERIIDKLTFENGGNITGSVPERRRNRAGCSRSTLFHCTASRTKLRRDFTLLCLLEFFSVTCLHFLRLHSLKHVLCSYRC